MQNWETKKLLDIVTQINGLWKGKKEPFINVAVIRNTNFSKDCQLKLDDVEYLDVELKQFESRKLKYGDIIIEKSGGSEKQPVGRPILFDITEGNYSFSNFTSTLRLKETSDVSSEYLQQYLYYRWLEGDTRNLQSHTTGIHNLDFKKYLDFEIPLPPLEEQKRIVKILDEKFAQLETVKANAKANLQNAKDLFQSQLTKAFSNTTWEKKRLGEVCDRIFAGGDKPKIFSEVKTEKCTIPIFANGIANNGLYGFTDMATVLDQSITISARGTIGFVCVREEPYVPIVRLLVLIPKNDVNVNYLKYGCRTLSISNTGSSIPQLTVPMIKDYKIPLPPLPEQKRIVEQLDSLSEKVRSLEEIYTKQLANCDELKQAFLKKAFDGEL